MKPFYFKCIIAFSLVTTQAFGGEKFIFTSLRKKGECVAFLFIQTDVKRSYISIFSNLTDSKLRFMLASNGERCGFNKAIEVIENKTFDLASFPEEVHPASILDKEHLINLCRKFLYHDYNQGIKIDEKIPSVLKNTEFIADFKDKNEKKKVIVVYMDGDEKHALIEDFLEKEKAKQEEKRQKEAIDLSIEEDVDTNPKKDYYTSSIVTASVLGAGTALYKLKGALNNKGNKKENKNSSKPEK